VKDALRRREFGPDVTEIRAARAFVRQTLSGRAGRFPVEEAVVVVSELATNAVVHARTPFSVEVAIEDGRVVVQVEDGNPRVPVFVEVPARALSGHGLQIVRGLTASWGVSPVPGGGKVVWAELSNRAPPVARGSAEAPIVGGATGLEV
jgi:anti-sigma regulatory factor (Ser/Thr protein kinase)